MNDVIIYKQNGQLTNRQVVAKFFNELPDGKFLLTAKNIKHRSLPQNAYYWSVCVPMVKEGLRDVGYNDVKTNEDAHEVLKHLFLKKRISNGMEEIIIAGSTAELKTVEFNNFLEEIWQWASSYLSITIPEPNQQLMLL